MVWLSLFMLPCVVGCHSHDSHTVITPATQPRLVRKVTTTTTTTSVKPPIEQAPVSQASVSQAGSQMVYPAELNASTMEVVKLHEALMSEAVMATYIQISEQPFSLDANQMIYLKDIGVSEEIIALMMKRDDILGHGGSPVAVNPPENYVIADPPVTVETASMVEPGESPVGVAPENLAPAVQKTTTVTTEYFHEQLEPYGAWVHVSDYGWCWRPTVAIRNPAWRPYCDNGRWVYSDCGWYWNSYYSWGWAPFHYGRWALHGSYGWVWSPGTVWGPSWVTWRTTDAYCGWAPLPPAAHYHSGIGFTYQGSRVSVGFGFGLGHAHYAFVSKRHFREDHVERHGIKLESARDVYQNSTIINNYNVVNNNQVINEGISVEQLNIQNREELKPVRLQDVAGPEKTTLDAGSGRKGDVLPVYRPAMSKQNPMVSRELLNRQSKRPALMQPSEPVGDKPVASVPGVQNSLAMRSKPSSQSAALKGNSATDKQLSGAMPLQRQNSGLSQGRSSRLSSSRPSYTKTQKPLRGGGVGSDPAGLKSRDLVSSRNSGRVVNRPLVNERPAVAHQKASESSTKPSVSSPSASSRISANRSLQTRRSVPTPSASAMTSNPSANRSTIDTTANDKSRLSKRSRITRSSSSLANRSIPRTVSPSINRSSMTTRSSGAGSRMDSPKPSTSSSRPSITTRSGGIGSRMVSPKPSTPSSRPSITTRSGGIGSRMVSPRPSTSSSRPSITTRSGGIGSRSSSPPARSMAPRSSMTSPASRPSMGGGMRPGSSANSRPQPSRPSTGSVTPRPRR